MTGDDGQGIRAPAGCAAVGAAYNSPPQPDRMMLSVPKKMSQLTILSPAATAGLGELRFDCPPGAAEVTPASRVAIRAIGRHQHLFSGSGLDWGCGAGCLAIAAARLDQVQAVLGLEIALASVSAARRNAALNGVAAKVEIIQSDSFAPMTEAGRRKLTARRSRTDFLLANPPASEGDDGLGYRRLILAGAPAYVRPGGVILLNISFQYGQRRVEQLCRAATGLSYEGVLESTEWVPFDLSRPDLRRYLDQYADEEQRGGLPYTFGHPLDPEGSLDARAALRLYRNTGQSPLTRWQVHLFRA